MKCYRKGGGCGPYEMLSCDDCPASKPEYAMRYRQIKTNADKLRAIDDEELARWVIDEGQKFGEELEGYMSLLDWLRQEAEQ